MEVQKKITVFDVAKAAGVSKGTVDRVLHNRGEVSGKSEARVRKAIEELGYQRNVYASMLATKNSYNIICLLPHCEEGEFWGLIRDGIASGQKYASNFNVNVECIYYDQYSPASFRSACADLIKSAPSGVVLPPLFPDDTARLVAELEKMNVPYSFVDTKIDDCRYLTYFGMPMRRSGELAAFLMTERCASDAVDNVLVIRLLRDKESLADPTAERREGFIDYMGRNFPSASVDSIFIDPKDKLETERVLSEYFGSHPQQRFVVMFNSRIHLIADFLGRHPLPGRRVIGFDNLKGNIEALESGVVDILVSQHASHQSEYAIKSLVDSLVWGNAPEKRDNYMHMDIITRFNVLDY